MVTVEVAVILCLNNEKGLTLVEVIAAIIIIGVLGMAFAMALITGTQSEIEVSQRYEASSIASSIIDSLRDEVLFNKVVNETLNNKNNNSYNGSLNEFIEDTDNVNNLKTRIENIINRYEELELLKNKSSVEIDSTDIPNLYDFAIIIRWKESDQELSYELRTMLYADKSD